MFALYGAGLKSLPRTFAKVRAIIAAVPEKAIIIAAAICIRSETPKT